MAENLAHCGDSAFGCSEKNWLPIWLPAPLSCLVSLERCLFVCRREMYILVIASQPLLPITWVSFLTIGRQIDPSSWKDQRIQSSMSLYLFFLNSGSNDRMKSWVNNIVLIDLSQIWLGYLQNAVKKFRLFAFYMHILVGFKDDDSQLLSHPAEISFTFLKLCRTCIKARFLPPSVRREVKGLSVVIVVLVVVVPTFLWHSYFLM